MVSSTPFVESPVGRHEAAGTKTDNDVSGGEQGRGSMGLGPYSGFGLAMTRCAMGTDLSLIFATPSSDSFTQSNPATGRKSLNTCSSTSTNKQISTAAAAPTPTPHGHGGARGGEGQTWTLTVVHDESVLNSKKTGPSSCPMMMQLSRGSSAPVKKIS